MNTYAHGARCKKCDEVHHWKDMPHQVDKKACTWTWFCPTCEIPIRVDEKYHPDLP